MLACDRNPTSATCNVVFKLKAAFIDVEIMNPF